MKRRIVRKKRKINPWTTGEEDKLIKMFNKGKTIKEIAKELKRNTGSISWKIKSIRDKQENDTGFEV